MSALPLSANDGFFEHPCTLLLDGRDVEPVGALDVQSELAEMARFEGRHDERVVSG